MCKSNKTIDEKKLKFIKGVIEEEDHNISDRVYRMTLARMKLMVSENGQDALVWMIRYLVSTHPDPQPEFDRAIKNLPQFQKELKWISIVMENEIEHRYVVLEKGRK